MSIKLRAACSPRSLQPHPRHGVLPFPAAAAASCRFWPFWPDRVRHAQSDNSVCALVASWRFCRILAAKLLALFTTRGFLQLYRQSRRSVTLALEAFAHRLAV